ncbi:heat shock protein beta-11 [Centropristis striata]|uniref:heat shock protein beta-11 n=1 Tax=Centropristis striata TaxID=184440 RepID=UPI0027E13C6E|nr:heat shock protein beta-11 [Centropristis striata]
MYILPGLNAARLVFLQPVATCQHISALFYFCCRTLSWSLYSRMLCPSVFQPSAITMRPFLEPHWPIRSLWPETRPLFYHLEQEMIRHMQEMRQSMEYMERLHQKIFEEIDQTSSSTGFFKPIAFQELGKDSSSFALSLDTKEFCPEELSVKQVGRKLRVSGKTEKKQEDDKGSYSYRCQEFRQEFDLPDGVDPETVTCSLVDGRLQIQAPREKMVHDGKERVVPISLTSVPAITSSSISTSSSESSPAEKN